MDNDIIKIYSDGSCLGNPGFGGYASILMYGDNSKTIKGSEVNTTNNRMELSAVISALKFLKKSNIDIEIYVDSEYVRKGISEYIHKWLQNGWKTANKQSVKNVDLWMELHQLTNKFKIKWNWVKGHNNDPLNDLVDKIARKEAENLKGSTL